MRLPSTTPSPVKIIASRAMSFAVESSPPVAKMLVTWNGWTFPPWITGATFPAAGIDVG